MTRQPPTLNPSPTRGEGLCLHISISALFSNTVVMRTPRQNTNLAYHVTPPPLWETSPVRRGPRGHRNWPGVGVNDYIELRAHSAYSLLRGTSPPETLVACAVSQPVAFASCMPSLALTDHNNVYGAVSFQKAAHALDIQPILGAELTHTVSAALSGFLEIIEHATPDYIDDPPTGWRATYISRPYSLRRQLKGCPRHPVGGRGRARQVSPLQSALKAGVGGRGKTEGEGESAALTLLVADEIGWENLCWLITQAQHQAPKGEGLLRFEQLRRTDRRADRAIRRARRRDRPRARNRGRRRRL